ncbi:calcitonin gene-related peptide type 1 receptor-like [Mytilus californianus]|uniref:calcitonin gene-related peptide type 1 receptor-like n=1 Tax=Mytilus californianus TaxID=6549 RepID=UPI00224661A5|nr:calcitonin gene-related peptide type 1 receptor-like [Mytilus californianus]
MHSYITVQSELEITINNDLGLIPDVSNTRATLEVCKYLDETNCERWKSCCLSAVECCKTQVPERQLTHKPLFTVQCPKTWDGFGCVSEANAGSIADIRCPHFVQYGFSSDYATKKCTKNGTWWRDPVSNREWTDYTPCLNLRIYKSMVYVGVTCCSISLILLIPASLTFLCLRQLRTQNRIRLHLCLFLSFIVTCVTTLMWDIFIYNDRLDNPASKTRMQQNTIFCRVLYTFNRYANSSNYFWMFCEGYYLHRLVLHAFKVPTNLAWYYIIGWGE